jgi:hypothetical protein
MMMQHLVHRTPLDYDRQREAQERAIAERCADPVARRLHLDLAERYAARLRARTGSLS